MTYGLSGHSSSLFYQPLFWWNILRHCRPKNNIRPRHLKCVSEWVSVSFLFAPLCKTIKLPNKSLWNSKFKRVTTVWDYVSTFVSHVRVDWVFLTMEAFKKWEGHFSQRFGDSPSCSFFISFPFLFRLPSSFTVSSLCLTYLNSAAWHLDKTRFFKPYRDLFLTRARPQAQQCNNIKSKVEAKET